MNPYLSVSEKGNSHEKPARKHKPPGLSGRPAGETAAAPIIPVKFYFQINWLSLPIPCSDMRAMTAAGKTFTCAVMDCAAPTAPATLLCKSAHDPVLPWAVKRPWTLG